MAAELDAFTRQYLETMLWSTTDQDAYDRGDDHCLDRNYSVDDIAPEALAQAIADCERFQRENAMTLAIARDELAARGGDGCAVTTAAHLFWLNRCGHGCGFWELSKPFGPALSDAAKAYGQCWPYAGDDGKIYGLGEK